ncbi:hypothetical protein PR048_016808 [Dryococelus australis]|uniref:Uncharacterized protein n=1 Tax=Dryococelus australis TaxID=614101 RepID=A0ABQ9H7Y0_9NEOP|nr:hypothetical protein PR048_016808 [Dryococelus australis]
MAILQSLIDSDGELSDDNDKTRQPDSDGISPVEERYLASLLEFHMKSRTRTSQNQEGQLLLIMIYTQQHPVLVWVNSVFSLCLGNLEDL